MRRKLLHTKVITSAVLSVVMVIASFAYTPSFVSAKENKKQGSADYSLRSWVDISEDTVIAKADINAFGTVAGTPEIKDGAVLVSPEDTVSFKVNVPSDGKYAIVLSHKPAGDGLTDVTAEVKVGEQSFLTTLYGLWQDETKDYSHDRYGNEVTPNQILLNEYVTDYVRNSKSLDMTPCIYDFKAGENVITLGKCDDGIYLKDIQVVAVKALTDYKAYLKNAPKYGTADHLITLEGEDYAVKSDSYIRVQSKQNPAVKPYSPYKKYLSTIDEGSYYTVGQRVVWNFAVKQDGWYNIAFHYSQKSKEGQACYRDIEIDGKPLYSEMKSVSFVYTGNKYKNRIFEVDGKPAKIYLSKGEHTLGLLTEAPEMQYALDEIGDIVSSLSEIGLSLQQVAGSSADRNRSWDIESYVPGVTEELKTLRVRLLDLYDKMGSMSGTTPASCSSLKEAAGIIEQALKKPEKLPSRVSEISIGNGSATELLATLQNSIRKQGIAIDSIYLYGENVEIPDASAGFFKSLISGIKRFFYSMFNKSDAYSTGEVEEGVLNVWVNRSVTHVETLQMLIDSRFTPETGIEVKLSVMPDANKLILANATDTCPDVAIGIPSQTPYQLALRGAAADLNQFDDLNEVINKNFILSDIEPYVFERKIYGLPETSQFYVLMYRTDIVDKLGIKIPETWDDVADIMPILRRNGMNFYLPISSNTGTKFLGGMVPYFFQTGTSLYSEDGFVSTFNSTSGIKAFETLTDLYSLYSLQNNMPSFYNNFRYGTTPIGVGDFNNYMQIYYAAPEIADSWSIALAPGTRNEDGSISRQQTSADKGMLIMQSSRNKKNAWEFMKWWVSDDTQTEFSRTLLLKFGSDFIWNSANKEAFSKISLPVEDRKILMEQRSLAQNYRNLPVTYMLERELSNAWYEVVENGESARIALNAAAVNVDSELKIKMQEFGYANSQGEKIRDYNTDSIEKILNGGENK